MNHSHFPPRSSFSTANAHQAAPFSSSFSSFPTAMTFHYSKIRANLENGLPLAIIREALIFLWGGGLLS